ncbi:MAG: HAMP domain-containing histidine kinase [Schleiferiaceae bacterium]|nr:HAMP domain-containing histidine kinase [Schleiferiaceae bacterium]
MLNHLMSKLRKHALTAVLTAAVLGALLLQLNLLSGELELQKQQFDSDVSATASAINERVRLFVKRKSTGALKQSTSSDSTVTLNTPMGTTTLRWSATQGANPYGSGFGIDTNMISGFLDDFQSSLPWETLISSSEMDSVLESELRVHGIRTMPKWAVVENGYLNSLISDAFTTDKVTYNFVLAESFFGPTRQLLMYFPSGKFYLASRVYLNLFVTLLFSTVILFAFFSVQRQGRKQKRLAAVKSDFISNMSHEFKTPLATISLAVDALLRNGNKMNVEQMQQYLGIIKSENKRMNAQMESVLQMSMMDKEELTLTMAPMDVEACLREAVEHFKLSAEQRQGWIDLSCDAGDYAMEGDAIQFKSALTNLIDNAIKYSLDAPQISVKLDHSNDQYIIKVKDRGIGMDEDTKRQVFDRFYRATKGNIHDVKGHGLGLSFVKEIVVKHGGSIQMESTLHVGTTFTLVLPKTE